MPAPYDYSGALSPIDPGQAVMQGVLTGQKMFEAQQQYQRGEQEYQRSEQQRQQMAQRAKQFQVDFESVIDDKDPRAITELLIRYPEQKQILETVGQRFSAEEKQQKMNQSIELIGLSMFGKNDEVIGFYENQADVLEKSGRPEEAANSRLQAQQFREDPDAARMQQQIIIAAQDPDKFLQNMDQIFETRQKYVQSRAEAAKAKSPPRQKLRDAGIIGEPIKTTDADKFANGLTMYRTKLGEIYGVDVRNNLLQGEELAEAAQEAQDFEAASVSQIAGARRRGALEVEKELKPKLSELVARATKRGEISQQLAKDSYETTIKARRNLGNLDAAIAAVKAGANTGVIQNQFPNWKASSIELKNIQRQLGLDVIGSVTFGALSEGELELALETALDLNLTPAALLDLLVRKKDAQSKMIAELEKATMFFAAGGGLGEYVQLQQTYEVPTGAQTPIGQTPESALREMDAILGIN